MLELKDIKKYYGEGDIQVKALDGVSLTVDEGEFVAIMGPSGSGKSTLMNIIGCLDRPTSGSYKIDDEEVASLKSTQLATIRNKKIGFVFQSFNLLSRTSALHNVSLPLIYANLPKKERQERARQALKRVGLEDRMHHKPNELSGGQKQRVAIARALAGNPSVILADEPTGNLDSVTTKEVMNLFCELNDEGVTVVMVTHESDMAEYTKRIITFKDGLLIDDSPVTRERRRW